MTATSPAPPARPALEPPPDLLEEEAARAMAGSHRRRRRGRLIALAAVCVVIAAAIAAWTQIRRDGPTASVQVRGAGDARDVVVSGGAIAIDQLASRVPAGSDGDALIASGADDAITLKADLVVDAGATVRIADAAVLLRSDAGRAVTIQVQNGGRLLISDSTIVSWDGIGVDAAIQDGRASIVADGSGSVLRIERSDVSYLGSGTDRPGVSWRDGAGGAVIDSTLDHGFRGADARDSAELDITGSRFTDNIDNGMTLDSSAPGTTIESSSFERNGGDGLSISDVSGLQLSELSSAGNARAGVRVNASSAVTADGLELHDNAAEGIKLDDSVGCAVNGVRAWSNLNGIAVSGGSATIEGGTVSGNVADGVSVLDAGTSATIRGVRMDHNARSGLWLAGPSSATIADSSIDRNGVGIRVDDESLISATGNTVTASVTDGFALPSPDMPRISGNTIGDSGQAAFSLPADADISALVSANTLSGEQEQLRVREDDGAH